MLARAVFLQLLAVLVVQTASKSQTLCTQTEVKTEITISASADKVWDLLLNTKEYPKWHPYIAAIEGDIALRKKIKVYTIDAQKNEGKFKAYILTLEPRKELAWGGTLGFVFRARHYFIIESLGDKQVSFVQGEYWKGWLGKWYGKKIYQKTFDSFNRMNQNMKAIVETRVVN